MNIKLVGMIDERGYFYGKSSLQNEHKGFVAGIPIENLLKPVYVTINTDFKLNFISSEEMADKAADYWFELEDIHDN